MLYGRETLNLRLCLYIIFTNSVSTVYHMFLTSSATSEGVMSVLTRNRCLLNYCYCLTDTKRDDNSDTRSLRFVKFLFYEEELFVETI